MSWWSAELIILGADVLTGKEHAKGLSERVQVRFDKARARLSRIATLPLVPHVRVMLVSSLPATLWTYLPVGLLPNQGELKKLRFLVLQALAGQSRLATETAQESVFAFLLPGHRLSPTYAIPYQLLCQIRRARVKGILPRHWADSFGDGIASEYVKSLSTFLQPLGLSVACDRVTFGDSHVSMTEHDDRTWKRLLRDLFRLALQTELCPVDRGLPLDAWKHAASRDWLVLWQWHAGSHLCKERHSRHSQGAVSSLCPWCLEREHHVDETISHIVCECPTWQAVLSPVTRDLVAKLPPCFAKVGLVPKGTQVDKKSLTKTQLDIARMLKSRQTMMAEQIDLFGRCSL